MREPAPARSRIAAHRDEREAVRGWSSSLAGRRTLRLGLRKDRPFSSEVETGSREENALKQRAGAVERSNGIRNGSRHLPGTIGRNIWRWHLPNIYKQPKPSPRLHLAPGDGEIWQDLAGPHTVVVTAGHGRLSTRDGNGRPLVEGDVATIPAGRYLVSNMSDRAPLRVLLLAA
jgi:hypothetical protein